MKRKNGKMLLFAAVLCAIVAAGFGSAYAASDSSVRNSTAEIQGSFYMEYGAQVKTATVTGAQDDTGIRFISKISEKFYGSLTAGGATVELHTLIAFGLGNETELTAGAQGAVDIVSRKSIAFDSDPATDDEFEFRAALYGLKNYCDGFGCDTPISARAYAKVTESGGTERIVYAESRDNTRSLRDIANSALASGEADENGVLAGYVEVGARENSVNGFIAADGSAEGYIDDLPSGNYGSAYIGAKSVSATVKDGGMVSFTLSEADKNILSEKSVGDEIALTVFADDGKAYSTKLQYTEKVPALSGVAASSATVDFNGSQVDAWKVRGKREVTVMNFDPQYIRELKDGGVKAVRIYFKGVNGSVIPGANLNQAPNEAYADWACGDMLNDASSEWKIFNLGGVWAKGLYGQSNRYNYRYSDTVLTPDDLSNFGIKFLGGAAETVNAYVYIETFTDGYPVVSSNVSYSTDTAEIAGATVIKVSPNLGVNIGFMLSEAYIDGFVKDGEKPKYFTVMVKSDAENVFANVGYSNAKSGGGTNGTAASLNHSTGAVYEPSEPTENCMYGWYAGSTEWTRFGARFTPEQLKAAHFGQTTGNYFHLYLIPDHVGALISSVWSVDDTITPTSFDFNGKNVDGYNVTFTDQYQTFGFTTEFVQGLKDDGVKAVRVWVNKQYYVKPKAGSSMADTTYDWRGGDAWSAVNIGGRYDKAYAMYALSDDVLVPDDLKEFDITATSAGVMSVYIEKFTDDYPMVSGKEYIEKQDTLADGSTGTVYRVELSCTHNNNQICAHNSGFMISAAYIDDLKAQGYTSITVMAKSDGIMTRKLGYLKTESGFDSWFGTDDKIGSWVAAPKSAGVTTFAVDDLYDLHICAPYNTNPLASYIEFYVIANR